MALLGIVARNDGGDGRNRTTQRQHWDAPISQGCYESIGNSVAVAKMRTVHKKCRHRAAARTAAARQMFIESLPCSFTLIFSQSE